MTELFAMIWSTILQTIEGLGSAIKTGFLNLIYVDPNATEKVVSDFAKFGFAMMGFGLGLTILFLIIRKIRG